MLTATGTSSLQGMAALTTTQQTVEKNGNIKVRKQTNEERITAHNNKIHVNREYGSKKQDELTYGGTGRSRRSNHHFRT